MLQLVAPWHLGQSAGDDHVAVVILQRMSDLRIQNEGACGGGAMHWRDGRCRLGNEWKDASAMGLAAIEDFNARVGSTVPQFASTLASCDKRLVATVVDSGSTGEESILAAAPALSRALLQQASLRNSTNESTTTCAVSLRQNSRTA